MPHKLCSFEQQIVHGLQYFAQTHSKQSESPYEIYFYHMKHNFETKYSHFLINPLTIQNLYHWHQEIKS